MVPLNSNNNVNSSGNNNNQQLATQNQLQQIQQNSTTQTSLTNGHHNGNNANNNTQQQHHTSSENSEQSVENAGSGITRRNSNYKKISNQLNSEADNKQQQQKTILLKFPQNLMETDQLIVSWNQNLNKHPYLKQIQNTLKIIFTKLVAQENIIL